MQEESDSPQNHRSNKARTEQTRGALIAAARALFVERGYADTSTPEIVRAAGVTRGALYHHFEDKRDLFRAVVAAEAGDVAAAIEAALPPGLSARDGLIAGSSAYFDAMTVPGRTRLLLIEGPAVLGHAELSGIEADTSEGSLATGIAAAFGNAVPADMSLPVLAALLSAAFDRAALAIAQGADAEAYKRTMAALLDRVVGAD